jgi:hypothetical protein
MNRSMETFSSAAQETLFTHLAASYERVQAQAQTLEPLQLQQLADTEAHLGIVLSPLPGEPGAQILAAHAAAHPHLERLTQYAPARRVMADARHSYTPRTILRRVLDHALDHLNQLEQWLVWQQHGVVPTPTDGWATSEDTLPEDFQPLSEAELQAWLWRIDLTVAMVANRAGKLSGHQLDWRPPDGGWSLRHIFQHLAHAEIYYSIWLDEELPEAPLVRYREAHARFERQLRHVLALPEQTQLHFLVDDALLSAEQVAYTVLKAEHALVGQNQLP